MDEQTYNELAARIAAGEYVTWNGRTAWSIEQLDEIAGTVKRKPAKATSGKAEKPAEKLPETPKGTE